MTGCSTWQQLKYLVWSLRQGGFDLIWRVAGELSIESADCSYILVFTLLYANDEQHRAAYSHSEQGSIASVGIP